MNLAVINGSIREQNTTIVVSRAVAEVAGVLGNQAQVVEIAPFGEFFRGNYLTLANATPGQRAVLEALAAADCLIFVVPTYYKGMPGALKNFFDIVRYHEIYQGKRIAVIASNHKNQDFGARQAEEVIKGILIFSALSAVVIPEILIQNYQTIQHAEIERFIRLIMEYPGIE